MLAQRVSHDLLPWVVESHINNSTMPLANVMKIICTAKKKLVCIQQESTTSSANKCCVLHLPYLFNCECSRSQIVAILYPRSRNELNNFWSNTFRPYSRERKEGFQRWVSRWMTSQSASTLTASLVSHTFQKGTTASTCKVNLINQADQGGW